MDYDYKTNLLKYEIDNEKIVKGEQNLKIVVIDKLNNKTVLKEKVYLLESTRSKLHPKKCKRQSSSPLNDICEERITTILFSMGLLK